MELGSSKALGDRSIFSLAKVWACSGALFLLSTTTVHAEVLCPSLGAFSQRATVHVQDFYPLRLSPVQSCQLRGPCEYEIGFVSGNNIENHFDGIIVDNLCSDMNIQRERYSRHTVSEFSNHPLDRIYMFSRKTVLQITGRQNRLLITRIDYTGLLPEQSWMSLNVDRGTVLTADVAASRYVITMEME